MTQKYLGLQLGFPDKSADVRMAQYETGSRTPKAGITVSETDGELSLKTNADKGKDATEVIRILAAWNEQKTKLETGEIDKETYDQWRYHHPKFDTTSGWVKVPERYNVRHLQRSPETRLRKKTTKSP